eukprot:TRINITY_DN4668_c0_g1_i15.p1 TRINITY_DN4668_c0_g1~~TRINITY_DN4668_c0_g1_i15.p1  ORF type:complete len:259 (-),score=49.39 TRINITY_DN4668_c0_g1_i15:559-1335(-)
MDKLQAVCYVNLRHVVRPCYVNLRRLLKADIAAARDRSKVRTQSLRTVDVVAPEIMRIPSDDTTRDEIIEISSDEDGAGDTSQMNINNVAGESEKQPSKDYVKRPGEDSGFFEMDTNGQDKKRSKPEKKQKFKKRLRQPKRARAIYKSGCGPRRGALSKQRSAEHENQVAMKQNDNLLEDESVDVEALPPDLAQEPPEPIGGPPEPVVEAPEAIEQALPEPIEEAPGNGGDGNPPEEAVEILDDDIGEDQCATSDEEE